MLARTVGGGRAVVGAARLADEGGAVVAAKAGRAEARAGEADAVRAAHARARHSLVAILALEARVAKAASLGAHAVAGAVVGAAERRDGDGAVEALPANGTDALPLPADPVLGAPIRARRHHATLEAAKPGRALALAARANAAPVAVGRADRRGRWDAHLACAPTPARGAAAGAVGANPVE